MCVCVYTGEMEIVPAQTTYRIRLRNDGEVVMSGEVWSYFRTLRDMTMDCGVSDMANGCLIQIPLSANTGGVNITTPILQTMIDFYAIVFLRGMKGVKEATESPFHEKWQSIQIDEQAMIELIMAANYLGTSELLVFVMDRLYTQVRRESTHYLETRVAQLSSSLKRKVERETTKNVSDRLRIQYRREKLVKLIMQALLPLPELVRGIDKRIARYVNPVACITNKPLEPLPLVVIQYDEDGVAITTDRQWRMRIEALYDEELSEVHGNGAESYAILNTDGQLSVFGVRNQLAYRDTPIGNTRVIAMWTSKEYMIFLTYDTLYVYNFDTGDVHFIRGLEEESSVLDVSIGSGHALILTYDGLYGVFLDDSWQRSQLSFGFRGEWPRHSARKLDVHGAIIRSILAREDYNIVVTTSGMVYTTGSMSTLTPLNIQIESGEWLPVPALSSLGVRLMAGDWNRLVVTTSNNETYVMGDYLRRQYKTPLKLSTIEGEIRSITSIEDKYFFVVTTTGLFVYNATPNQLNALGGTDSALPPYKLRLPFVSTIKNKPNKKVRLDCHVCCASATMLDPKDSRLFCSRYCFHSLSIKGDDDTQKTHIMV